MSSIEMKPNGNGLESTHPYQIVPDLKGDVDLLNLFITLFSAKVPIIAITLLFAVGGLVISALLPQKWTSQAVVTIPESKQVIELNRAVVNMTVLGVETKVETDRMFNLFLKKFDSQNLRERFLAESPYVKTLLIQSDVDKTDLNRAIVNVSSKFLSVDNSDPKKVNASPYSSWTLSFSAPDADDARQVLHDYIQFVSDAVNKDMLQDLNNAIDLKVSFEKDKLALDRTNLENQHNISIERLGYSLQVANAAGLKKPVYSNGQTVKDDPDYAVSLGADGLAEKLKIEKSIKDVARMDVSIQNREHLLTQLQAINIADVDFIPFKYQMQASLPVKKDGPGKSLIIFLAAFVGFLVAAGAVLIRHAMVSRVRVGEII